MKVKVIGSAMTKDDTFVNKDTGESVDYHVNKQPGVLIRAEFREPIDVRLEKGQPGFPLGEYELDIENMIEVRNGKLSMSKYFKLLPLGK